MLTVINVDFCGTMFTMTLLVKEISLTLKYGYAGVLSQNWGGKQKTTIIYERESWNS